MENSVWNKYGLYLCALAFILLFILLPGVQGYQASVDVELSHSLLLSFLIGGIGVIVAVNYNSLFNTVDFIYCIVAFIVILIGEYHPNQIRVTITVLIILLCGNHLFVTKKAIRIYYRICLIVCLIMAIYGLFQYAGLQNSYNTNFLITGFFDNPAGIAMYLAILFPNFLYAIKTSRNSIIRFFIIGCTMLVGITLILSKCRMAILAILVCMFFLYHKIMKRKYWNVLIISAIALMIVSCLYKPLSSQGRLFIVYITLQLILDSILVGHGFEGFATHYMLEQADFFRQNADTIWVYTAGNVQYPLNEFLHFFVRFGLIGFICGIILLLILVYIIRTSYQPQKKYALASLLSFCVCACFSYPLSYIHIIFLLALTISLLCAPHFTKRRTCSNDHFKTILIVLSITSIGLSLYQYDKERDKYKLEMRALNGESTEELYHDYQQTYNNHYFKRHQAFLYNYALYLYERGYLHEAYQVLQQCKAYKQDYNWQILNAYILQKLSHNELAINAFQEASYMIPTRLLPRYEMIRLYMEMGDYAQAETCAYDALRIPIKIHNRKTEYLRNKIEEYKLILERRCIP